MVYQEARQAVLPAQVDGDFAIFGVDGGEHPVEILGQAGSHIGGENETMPGCAFPQEIRPHPDDFEIFSRIMVQDIGPVQGEEGQVEGENRFAGDIIPGAGGLATVHQQYLALPGNAGMQRHGKLPGLVEAGGHGADAELVQQLLEPFLAVAEAVFQGRRNERGWRRGEVVLLHELEKEIEMPTYFVAVPHLAVIVVKLGPLHSAAYPEFMPDAVQADLDCRPLVSDDLGGPLLVLAPDSGIVPVSAHPGGGRQFFQQIGLVPFAEDKTSEDPHAEFLAERRQGQVVLRLVIPADAGPVGLVVLRAVYPRPPAHVVDDDLQGHRDGQLHIRRHRRLRYREMCRRSSGPRRLAANTGSLRQAG